MPPSWSTRLLSGGGSNSNSRSNSYNNRDKALPPAPTAEQDDSTIPNQNGSSQSGQPLQPRAFDPPPTLRPRTSNGKSHMHNRSSSHPLPRLFSRKKSDFNGHARLGNDIALDESLVPVLDEGRDLPTRHISGKRDGDEEGKVARRCMCCDSRVKVPKELDKFRCMACLTVNDLPGHGKNLDGKGGRDEGVRMGISVERTRAIVERCVVAYLEGRCRSVEKVVQAEERPGMPEIAKTEGVVIETPAKKDVRHSKELSDAPVASSPPETPGSGTFPPQLTHAATIRDFSDFDLFTYERPHLSLDKIHRPSTSGPGMPDSRPSTVRRKPVPSQPTRKPPPPPLDMARRTASQPMRPHPSPRMASGERSDRPQRSPRMQRDEQEARKRYDHVKTIFRPLEDYIANSYGDLHCLNTSFSTSRPAHTGRARSESHIATPPPETLRPDSSKADAFDGLDAKTLLLGDIGENGSWWTGKNNRDGKDQSFQRKKVGSGASKPVNSRSPNINWAQLAAWYNIIHSAGSDWQRTAHLMQADPSRNFAAGCEGRANMQEIDEDLAEAREHAVRALLKVTENLLKRPGKFLHEPEDLRWLLIILANPSLDPSRRKAVPTRSPSGLGPGRIPARAASYNATGLRPPPSPSATSPKQSTSDNNDTHPGLLKRVFGLIANSTDLCHRYLITWLSRFDEQHFTLLIDLTASFVTHRVARCGSKPRRKSLAADGGLIPDLSGGAMNTSVQLHSAMGLGGSVKKRPDDNNGEETDWANDWQCKVAAKSMSLLFAANNIFQGRRTSNTTSHPQQLTQLLPTPTFYNTLLDYHDLIPDFRIWEAKKQDKFSFCQYPLFLSMGAKIKILEFDARRQMELKAREAYFDQVIRQRAIDGHFHLRVRRECLVDDSLRQISAAVGAGQEELKKGLRVHFAGEEGIDAGGPRKEWFLMLVREVFDAEHALFVYDEESRACWFNAQTFESGEQYYLVGALLGLAIYNSTILDIALPPFAFRKLLASAPGATGKMQYTLSDLAELHPQLATGLQQLLDFDGNVEETYCWSFTVPITRYGTTTQHPLIPNGEATPVTSSNRTQFVEAYIRFLLDTSVSRQFEPFKRGFFTVCAGNALSLFRGEEIELLVRGSEEQLDVSSLKAVAVYENWKTASAPHTLIAKPVEDVPVIGWFWDAFASASPERQRKLLMFITGSDRIPAVGATSLVLRLVAGGDGTGGASELSRVSGRVEGERFPVARTCFNMLILWGYGSREVLDGKLWGAVEGSEGFGLK